MKTCYIFALILLQRSLSMESSESNSSSGRLLNNYDTSSTENSTNDNEFFKQLEKTIEYSKNDEFQKDDSEEWDEYNERADYMNDTDIKTNEINDDKIDLKEPAGFQSNKSQYEIQQAQKQQERDEAQKESNLKLAAHERFPNMAAEWIDKAFFWYGDLFMREAFLDALAKYGMSHDEYYSQRAVTHEDVNYAFKTFGDERACQYLDEVIADKILAHNILAAERSALKNTFNKDLLGKFGFQYNRQPSAHHAAHAKYFNFREHWVKKSSECQREYKRFLRDVANLQDLFEAQSKHIKSLIVSFLVMEDRFNLALTSKTMLENSGLLGKHMFLCIHQHWDLNLDAEFCPKDFKMIRLCIRGECDETAYDFSLVPKFLYTDVSIVMILPDENDAWHTYTFEGKIMIPEKGINIEIVNKEIFNFDTSDLEKLKKNASKKVVWKQEKMDGKTDQKAIVRIICRKYFYFQKSILKLHFQK